MSLKAISEAEGNDELGTNLAESGKDKQGGVNKSGNMQKD